MNLTELAKTPVAFDTQLAGLHEALAIHHSKLSNWTDRVHRAAGDSKGYVGRSLVWKRTWAEVARDAKGTADGDKALAQAAAERSEIAMLQVAIHDMDQAYTGWTRFYPSVTKSQPHIHRSLGCHTLHPTTVMRWEPALSGQTFEQAVADLDEALCSVCFPGAPVRLHNYVSRKSQAAQAERRAEKDAREQAKAAKTLTTAEQFRTSGHYGEKVTTVAKLKDLVRKAVELEVEVEYWTQVADGTRSTPQGWSPDLLANRRRNLADSLSEARVDAAKAAELLVAREGEQAGWGADWDAIEKMVASKRKSARKEWDL